MKNKVKYFSKTCVAYPAQWEGQLMSGEGIYIRYRFGNLIVSVNDLVLLRKNMGNGLDGYMSTEEMQDHTRELFDWSEAEYGYGED